MAVFPLCSFVGIAELGVHFDDHPTADIYFDEGPEVEQLHYAAQASAIRTDGAAVAVGAEVAFVSLAAVQIGPSNQILRAGVATVT